jgi:hypothetical protein
MSGAMHTPGPWALFEVGDRIKRMCPAAVETKTSILTVVGEDETTFAAVLEIADARDQIAAGRGTAVWHEVVIGALEFGDFERGALHELLEASVPDPRLSISTGDQS